MKQGFWKTHLWDSVLIGVCACLSLGLALYAALPKGSAGQQAEITLDGKRLDENGLLSLKDYSGECQEVRISGLRGEMVLGVKKDGICVLSSTCPSQYCVHQGWIQEPGRPLVCAYNHVVITLLGEAEADFIL